MLCSCARRLWPEDQGFFFKKRTRWWILPNLNRSSFTGLLDLIPQRCNKVSFRNGFTTAAQWTDRLWSGNCELGLIRRFAVFKRQMNMENMDVPYPREECRLNQLLPDMDTAEGGILHKRKSGFDDCSFSRMVAAAFGTFERFVWRSSTFIF